jgi:broad specificity phosphatase PhoE
MSRSPPPSSLSPLSLVVMRHSARLDGDRAFLASAAAGGAAALAAWPDRAARPFDTPICDDALPGAAARAAAQAVGGRGVVAIVCSPFRRTLQTAGHCARALGLARVRVHFGLGEAMYAVAKHLPADGRFSYLDAAAMADALGEGVALELPAAGPAAAAPGGAGDEEDAGGAARCPPLSETAETTFLRYAAALHSEAARFASASEGEGEVAGAGAGERGALLVVSHGNCVEAASRLSASGQFAYSAPVCSWLELRIMRADDDGGVAFALGASGGEVLMCSDEERELKLAKQAQHELRQKARAAKAAAAAAAAAAVAAAAAAGGGGAATPA